MNRKRVQMLRDMIAGIPSKNINLNRVYSKPPTTEVAGQAVADCGTIACIWGWARLYPPFVEQGISHYGWLSGSRWFGINPETFMYKFPDEVRNHKQAALRRLDKLLRPARTRPEVEIK